MGSLTAVQLVPLEVGQILGVVSTAAIRVAACLDLRTKLLKVIGPEVLLQIFLGEHIGSGPACEEEPN